MRWPTRSEVTVQLALAVILVLFVSDYLNALSARCDLTPHSQFCDVWGATEGPAGDTWNCRSREAYLWSSFLFNAVAALAIVAPFFVRSRRAGFIAMSVIVVVGRLALNWLGPLAFP